MNGSIYHGYRRSVRLIQEDGRVLWRSGSAMRHHLTVGEAISLHGGLHGHSRLDSLPSLNLLSLTSPKRGRQDRGE